MKRNQIIGIAVVVLVVVGVAVGISQREDSSIREEANKASASSETGSGGSSESGTSTGTDSDSGAETSTSSGKQRSLPDFEGELFGGGTLKSADIEAPAVIHIYGSWCPTCQGEAPAFAQMQRKHPDLNYYYVAVEDNEDATAEFVKEYGWKTAPTIDDFSREVETEFGLVGQPHTIFVAKNGAITLHQGPGSFGDLNMNAEKIA